MLTYQFLQGLPCGNTYSSIKYKLPTSTSSPSVQHGKISFSFVQLEKIQEAIREVIVDQPIVVLKKNLPEPGKPAIETPLFKESSSESESGDSGHTKMDLEPEGETPEGE